MKNEIILVLVLIGSVLISGCSIITSDDNNTQLANPSATFCVEQGYEYSIRDAEGGQKGFCIFDDNTECGGWDYYYGTCTIENSSPCKDLCGDGECSEVVCEAIGCPCAESITSCPIDCN